MKDLVENIVKIKKEIDDLERERNGITNLLRAKKERLETLEKLTVNQLDMFGDGA